MCCGIARGVGIVILALSLIVAVSGPSSAFDACVGDCDGNGVVGIDELITGVDIALGAAQVGVCPAFECPQPVGGVFVNCAVEAVDNALFGCAKEPTAVATHTCPPAAPPRTCRPGEDIVCADQQCSVDCSCVTVTPTPTPTNTCTPGFDPPPGCGFEGYITPTPTPPALELSLAVQVNTLPDASRVELAATVSHGGGPVVSYRVGCTAKCRPEFYTPISFDVIGPDGNEVILDYPCGGRLYCPEALDVLLPGASLSQTRSVTGIAWTQHESYPGECDGCIETRLTPGHYAVVAHFVYWIGRNWTDPTTRELTQTAEFDWPPATGP